MLNEIADKTFAYVLANQIGLKWFRVWKHQVENRRVIQLFFFVDIFRGCYKGELDVDPMRLGCNRQGRSTWCFCDSDRCNVGAAPTAY